MCQKLFFIIILYLLDFINGKERLIIDNDAGGDDAMAIFMALLYEKHFNGPEVIGLTTCNGNTNEDNVSHNNQRILKVANRQDVPIFRGSTMSLVETPPTTTKYGIDGLGDSGENTTGLAPAQNIHAVLALIDLSKKYEDQLSVVTIGTLTNVAMAIRLDPEFMNRLKQLYIGAGHVYSENIPYAESNASSDVEAYHIVANASNPDKVTIFPFSQTMTFLNISKVWRENVLGSIDTNIIKAQNQFERVSLKRRNRWYALDPAMVAMVLNPDLVEEYQYTINDIILCGERRGINTNTIVTKDKANVRIINAAKKEEYKQFLLDVFSSDK